MNRQFKCMLLLMSILALLVSACDSQPLPGAGPARAQGAEPSPGAQMEAGSMSEDSVSGADQGISVESSQASQVAPGMEDANQAVAPEDIPSLEERDAMLGGVNLSGPVLPQSGQAPAEGPPPGTESVTGSVNVSSRVNPEGDPVNLESPDLGESVEVSQAVQGAPVLEDASQAVDPEDIPSLEERDAMLDGVNRGGLVLPESEQAPAGEGPVPGTESVPGPGAQPSDILDEVNQGGPVLVEEDGAVGEGPEPETESVVNAESVSNTPEKAGPHPLGQLVEVLLNWLQKIFG